MFPQPNLRERLAWLPPFLGLLVLVGGLIACGIWLARQSETTTSEAERMEARVRYVRMPGHPDVCVATLPGKGGFGPSFIGATRCVRVHDRVEFDEQASFDLGRFATQRIKDTSECLAYGPDDFFTFPCAPDDD